MSQNNKDDIRSLELPLDVETLMVIVRLEWQIRAINRAQTGDERWPLAFLMGAI